MIYEPEDTDDLMDGNVFNNVVAHVSNTIPPQQYPPTVSNQAAPWYAPAGFQKGQIINQNPPALEISPGTDIIINGKRFSSDDIEKILSLACELYKEKYPEAFI